jgi:hypothetical protein
MAPEKCAEQILKGVAAGKEELLVGGVEVYSTYLKRLFPTLLSALIRSHPARFRDRLMNMITLEDGPQRDCDGPT